MNPIVNFGVKSADVILAEVNSVDASQRKLVLRSILDTIDPTLWSTVERTAAKFRIKYDAHEALKRALAASLADGFMRDIVRNGKGCKLALSGMEECLNSPFSTICCQPPFVKARFNQTWANLNGYEGLQTIRAGETLDLGSDMTRAGESLALGNWFTSAMSTAYNAAGSALSTVANYACKALNVSNIDLAVGAGAALLGGPGAAQAGVTGAQALQNQCNSGGSSGALPPPKTDYTIYVIGGAAALVVLALVLR